MKSKRFAMLLIAVLVRCSPALAGTVWYVNGVSGSDNNNCLSASMACRTIGHAISLALSGDSVMVAAATYTENLGIGVSLNVIGAGASTTIIDGGGVTTVVLISSGTHVTLSKFTIRHGASLVGGGINNHKGTLTINNSNITGNRAVRTHFGGLGGGVYSSGRLIINNCKIQGNSASGAGGGIWGGSTLINNSTISGNGTTGDGGGIAANNLMINNSTISGNTAYGGGGIGTSGGMLTISSSTISGNSATIGGGISNGGTATLKNSIVANSSSGGNCSGIITSQGHNLSSDDTCNFNNTGDLNNTDPMLGPLQNNGGPTQTQALLSGSPAIDAGEPLGCTDGKGHLLKTDQRGKRRPDPEDTGGCDMGAYERQSD